MKKTIIGIVGILGIILILITILEIFKISDSDFLFNDKYQNISIKENKENLKIDVSSLHLIIKEGDKFEVETASQYIKIKEDSKNIYIKEEDNRLLKIKSNDKITILIPKDFSFTNVSIHNGAGKVTIEQLIADNFDLDVGAGKISISNLVANNQARIDTGASKTAFENVNIHNLHLNTGVGSVQLNGKLSGVNEIDAGVGTLKIKLSGSLEDYKIKVDKGIGTCKIDGSSVSDNTYYGNGENIIVLDGGVGSIHVDFENSIQSSKTFTRTYTVLNKIQSNEENKYYVTLQVFQKEVDTVLIEDSENLLQVDKTYEFTFYKNNNQIQDTIDSIFSNSEIIQIKETNKLGLEQVQEQIR